MAHAIGLQLRHEPVAEGEAEVLRAAERHFDQRAYLLARDDGDGPARVGGHLEGGEPVLVEVVPPKVGGLEMAAHPVSGLGGGPARRHLGDEPVALVDPGRQPLVAQLRLERPPVCYRQG